ncbi:MAG: type II toxin-antitoxin system Phd/YefM family antitoxin [Desulfuromonadales bacterium]|nr:type II toxin-antitoxin system Phd/YefM family antitoxin [Desulfuromonadales bacterium]
MSQFVSKSQFKPRSLEYFRKIEQSGEELVITDHGRPVLKVIPYVADPEECFRGLRNTVLQYDNPLEPVGVESWEALK